MEICFGKDRKYFGKRKKMLVTSIFSFSQNVIQKDSDTGQLKIMIV